MRRLGIAAAVVVLLLAAAQFFQPERNNPPADPSASFEAVAKPPQHVAAIIGRACSDCHTDQTVWPWYSAVSPVSWMVARDVQRGRTHLNFSRWNIYSPEMSRLRMGEICEAVRAGKMPLWYYTPIHPNAKLGSREVALVCGLSGS
jgi:heme-binding protein